MAVGPRKVVNQPRASSQLAWQLPAGHSMSLLVFGVSNIDPLCRIAAERFGISTQAGQEGRCFAKKIHIHLESVLRSVAN